MTNPEKAGSVIGIVIVFALVLLGIQSCMYTAKPISDELILKTGRERFQQTIPAGEKVEIIHERVVRPGINGGEFGYWLSYRRKDDQGNWIEKDHYDE